VNATVVYEFKTLLETLERDHNLDVNNDLHIWALHYVVLPRLNQALSDFAKAHNNHPMSSERQRSPRQLWLDNADKMESVLDNDVRGSVDDMFGVDESGPLPPADERAENQDNHVHVPKVPCPLTVAQLSALRKVMDPQNLALSTRTLWVAVVRFCKEL